MIQFYLNQNLQQCKYRDLLEDKCNSPPLETRCLAPAHLNYPFFVNRQTFLKKDVISCHLKILYFGINFEVRVHLKYVSLKYSQKLYMEEGKDKFSPKSDKEDKSVTSQVLDYYKHYSQNRELPKYFCGTSEVQLDDWKQIPIVINPISEAIPIISPTDKEIPKIHIENVCIPSPSSSIASNRKLEWDSGADIGYSNTNLHKSVSLPVLTDAEYKKLRINLLDNQPGQSKNEKQVVDCTEPKSDVNFKLSDFSSTSESLKSSGRGYISTTPSSRIEDDFISDCESGKAQRLRSLTKMVGLPIAQSTQLSDNMEYCSTPKPRRNSEFNSSTVDQTKIDLKVVDRISQYKNMKLLKLDVCKPIVVECSGLTQPPGRSKQIQTSLSINAVSIGVQTDFDFSNCQVITPHKEIADKQNVFYVCHADSQQENDLSNSSTMHTQTPSDFSNCDSFQYFNKSTHQSKINSKRNKSVKHSDSYCTSAESDKENLPILKTKQSDSDSLTSALLKNRKESGNIKDLQRAIDLLQKLMHSKKYDSFTKKYYLKAIIKQFVDSKSDSSESILPKSELSENISTLSEGGSVNKKDSAEGRGINIEAKKKVLKKLRRETFTNEIPPSAVAPNNSRRKLKRSHLTLTDSDLYDTVAASTNANTKERQGANESNVPISPQEGQGRALINSSLSSKSVTKNESEKSWREDMTRSEKLFLEKGAGDVCSLRKSQLNDQIGWINEVGKLKEILQTHGATKTSMEKELCKPRIEELNGISKTTTVYVLSTEKEIIPPVEKQENNTRCSSKCKCSDNKSSTFRNAVIEVGGEKIHLQDAHLVSSEQFTSRVDNAKCTTVVRRYTFEIPLEEIKSNNAGITPVYEDPNSHLKNRSDESSKKSDSSSSNEVSGAPLHKHNRSSKKSGNDKIRNQSDAPKNPFISKESSEDRSKSESTENSTSNENGDLKSRPPRVLGRKNERSHKKKLKQQVLSIESVTHLDVRSIAQQKDSEVEQLPNPTNELGDEASLTSDLLKEEEVESTYSSQSESTSSASLPPRNYSSLIEELVYVDEIPSSSQIPSKNSQESRATKNEALSKEFVYSDTIPSAYNPEKIIAQLSESNSSKPTSSLCACCKERKVQTKSNCCQCCDTQSMSCYNDNEKYILCYPCYNHHQHFANTIKPYFQKGYVCTCYPKQSAHQGTVEEIKKTIQKLEDLETETEVCNCDCSCNKIISSANFCEHCNRRLRPRYRRRKGGLAYSLTLESDECLYRNVQNFPMESLEEIKIRVPSPTAITNVPHYHDTSNDKSHVCKNKRIQTKSDRQFHKQNRDKSEQAATKTSDASTKCSHCFCFCHSVKVVSDQTQTANINQANKGTDAERTSQKTQEAVISRCKCKCKSEEKSREKSTSKCCKLIALEDICPNCVACDCHRSRPKIKKDKPCTLQEYLSKNRPTFIVMAEQRRQCLIDLATVRGEHSKKKYKQIFASNQKILSASAKPSQNFKAKRPFTSKEMKQITANNYKKCPEVKRKLEDIRERQIKKANKLIYDVFNQVPSKPHRIK
ncbi:hypothetical protein RI129_006207 [Pyrocoelia pectoralis]|uniref:ALMS motif domain-containing protein n=1 Tax=Pyrocoelia pectoralis TaxID=417401 RepID=A0AAN7VC28_9COLE